MLNTVFVDPVPDLIWHEAWCSKPSNILRLLRKHETFVPLREELEFIDDYLDIERFGSVAQLADIQEVDEETLDAFIPSMLLQPIIENAIKHGLARGWREGRYTPADAVLLIGFRPAHR